MDKIENSCTELIYHMGGGITLNEAWSISSKQRNSMVDFINKIYKDREEAQTGKKNL